MKTCCSIFLFNSLLSCVFVMGGCGNDPEHGSISSYDPELFGYWFEPKPGEITESDLIGKYYHVFTSGKSILELKKDKYRFIIEWESGNKYISEWNRAELYGLDSERPLVSLSNIRLRLIRQETKTRRVRNVRTFEPLEKKLSEQECDSYPEETSDFSFGFNKRREIILNMGVDPDYYFRKMPENVSEDNEAIDKPKK